MVADPGREKKIGEKGLTVGVCNSYCLPFKWMWLLPSVHQSHNISIETLFLICPEKKEENGGKKWGENIC